MFGWIFIYKQSAVSLISMYCTAYKFVTDHYKFASVQWESVVNNN